MNLQYISLSICVLAICGCSGGSGSSLLATPLWTTVNEKTSCEALDPAHCSGYYGFSVDNLGNYVAGPNAQGQFAMGVLTSGEYDTLKAYANAVAIDIQSSPTALCQALPGVPGVSDAVAITMGGGSVASLQDTSNNDCAYDGHAADTTALIDDMDSVRAKYYPSPF